MTHDPLTGPGTSKTATTLKPGGLHVGNTRAVRNQGPRDSGLRAARHAGLQHACSQPGFWEWASKDMCNYRQFYPVQSVRLPAATGPHACDPWWYVDTLWTGLTPAGPSPMDRYSMDARAGPTRGARSTDNVEGLQKPVTGIF